MTLISDEELISRLKTAIATKKRNIEAAKQNVHNLENQLMGMNVLYAEVCNIIEEEKDKESSPKHKTANGTLLPFDSHSVR